MQTKADLNNHMPGHLALAYVAGYSSFYRSLNGTKLCFSWNCQVSNNTQGESHRVKNQDTRSKQNSGLEQRIEWRADGGFQPSMLFNFSRAWVCGREGSIVERKAGSSETHTRQRLV